MIAQIQAAGKQQTSLEKVSGWQEGASVSLSKESPITKHLMCFSGSTGSNASRWFHQLCTFGFS